MVAAINNKPVETTVFVPLSGRSACWPQLAAFLKNQQIDRATTKLYLLDTSHSLGFQSAVRRWVQTADYARCHHVLQWFSDGPLADKPRNQHFDAVNNVMVQIYQHAQQVAEGSRLFIVEDDVIPPLDAFERLNSALDPAQDVFSVSGAYPIREYDAWTAWRDTGSEIRQPGAGVEEVQATGLGCVVLDAEWFRAATISWSPRPAGKWPWGYDMEFFADARAHGGRVLIDWSVVCQHLNKQGTPWWPRAFSP